MTSSTWKWCRNGVVVLGGLSVLMIIATLTDAFTSALFHKFGWRLFGLHTTSAPDGSLPAAILFQLLALAFLAGATIGFAATGHWLHKISMLIGALLLGLGGAALTVMAYDPAVLEQQMHFVTLPFLPLVWAMLIAGVAVALFFVHRPREI